MLYLPNPNKQTNSYSFAVKRRSSSFIRPEGVRGELQKIQSRKSRSNGRRCTL